MTTHPKVQPRLSKLRRRRERRRRLLAKGINPDEYFVNGFFLGKKENA